jgi:hypothetical protein
MNIFESQQQKYPELSTQELIQKSEQILQYERNSEVIHLTPSIATILGSIAILCFGLALLLMQVQTDASVGLL